MRTRAAPKLGLALALLALFHLSAVAQETAWHTMSGPENTFTAELPTEPKYTTTQLRAPGTGTAYTMHQYLLDDDQRAFIVQSIVYPKDVNLSDPQATLQNALNNTAKRMEGGKWTTIDWVKHEGGLTAVDVVGARDGQEVRSYLVIKGRQVFTLIYAGPPGSARSGDAARFLGSLKVAP
jgi:hypothetical protein